MGEGGGGWRDECGFSLAQPQKGFVLSVPYPIPFDVLPEV